MTAPNSTTLKFSILLIILLAFQSSAGEVVVTIFNRLVVPPHPSNITVHCKSQDDDLGFHTLLYTDYYEFSFKPNFIRTTLFFCSFTWPGNPHRHYLDIYDAQHDTCEKCTWNINLNGGCLNDHKCGPWKSIDLMDADPPTI
ncbi:unnamed protein product [Trifolium pratense]|uniref:Uncharacterized protein n=1 Tax=Trifolium pratense TaxID=57577 RepID=A0ACB0LLK0_TRIPR|nr:unnamed protein product [Trifolium pratense]